ncbi:COX15/CtaA family protein, partial [Alicyclobacillus sp.]|uniref:COX15/CtaA family protein n=1 Tax=Alicyclobacillus sp. TaxID=61169 RepID=UPI0025B8A2D1
MNWKVPLTASVVTAVQMTLGAVVVGTDAGFSCPDWPLCNGVLFPRLDGLVALELVHRGTALVVMALVGWFAVGALRQSTDGRLRRLAWGVVASVGVQVVVGGLIVLTHAPGITTT